MEPDNDLAEALLRLERLCCTRFSLEIDRTGEPDTEPYDEGNLVADLGLVTQAVRDCEAVHPPEEAYVAWVAMGRPDPRDIVERLRTLTNNITERLRAIAG